MGNEATITKYGNSNVALFAPGQPVQSITECKFSKKTLSSGTLPSSTDFFTSAPSADYTVDNYDGANQLVTSFKTFTVKGISVDVQVAASASGLADLQTIVANGVLLLNAQNKDIGRIPIRFLGANGGVFAAGAQVAAGSNVGVTNGTPINTPFLIDELTFQPNQNFKASLLMPSVTTVSISNNATVQVCLIGEETRPVG